MRRLPLARIAAAGMVLLGVVVWFGGSASADAPIKQGWWSRWQQPTATSVSLTLPVTLPPPSTASGGLTVGRSATREEAVAALYFQVAPGADATLYLGAADATGVKVPPGSAIQACPATSSWSATMNGAWTEAPLWSDEFCETGAVVSGDLGVFWTLPSTLQDEDGVYDLVLVPRGQVPYIVNFAPTGEATLVPGETPPEPESTTTTTEPESTTTTTEPVVDETEPLVTTDIPGTGGGTAFPVVTTAVPPRTPTSLVAFGPPTGIADRLPLPDTRAERIMAVSVLFFMATALWWLGGNPARMPRLIGALAGDGRVVVAQPEPRGVGRFARVRDAVRAPRL